jgi:hypothetical protein
VYISKKSLKAEIAIATSNGQLEIAILKACNQLFGMETVKGYTRTLLKSSLAWS